MKKLYNPIITSAVFFLICFSLSAQEKIVFRFNADYNLNSDLNTPVNINNVPITANLSDTELKARGTEGWGYNASEYARFSGDGSIISVDPVAVSYFGTARLSGEIWFSTNTKDGFIFEWDDSSKSNGFQVYLIDGVINLDAKLEGERYTLVSGVESQILVWQRLNWVFERSGNELKLSIFQNEILAASQVYSLSTTGSSTIVNAGVKLGLQSYNHNDVPPFSGDLYAADIKNYIPEESYFTSYLPYDGSGYLGIAGFHDYPVGSTDENIDLRLTRNNTPVDARVFVPYMDENFIPQGVTNSFEDENYNSDSGYIYVSMYNKTVDNVTREKRSIIVEIDPSNNYKVRRCFRLRGVLEYSHVGGIAFHDNSIYVSSARSIERYSLPPYDRDTKYVDLFTESSKYYSVQAIASFVTYYRDTMWVGDYVSGSASSSAYLYGYPLDSEGNVVNDVAPALYRLPKQVQGVAWIEENNQDVLFISSSEGNNSSSIYKVYRDNLFRTELPVIDTTYKVPTGAEDISFDKGGNMINVSESAAKYFQKRSSPWDAYYPFVFIINNRYLLDKTSVGIEDDYKQDFIPDSYALSSYPNPFNGQLALRYYLPENADAELVFFNILGVKVDSAGKLRQSKGWHNISWKPLGIASGMYFPVLFVNGYPRSQVKVMYVK